jgi:hypothetical protein
VRYPPSHWSGGCGLSWIEGLHGPSGFLSSSHFTLVSEECQPFGFFPVDSIVKCSFARVT